MAIERVINAQAATEGAGVRIRRAIGTQALRNLDPFLMLDFFDNEHASDYLAGFPDHPHRGFITLTYMLAGRMEHRDSMGHAGVIGPGDAQWMKAASGVIHSEMPKQIEGRMAGFQLWINLPADQKMADPDYQEYARHDFPTEAGDGKEVRVLAGRHAGLTGPISDPNTDVHYLDVRLEPGRRFRFHPPTGHRGFVFVHAGRLTVGERTLATGQLGLLDGREIAATARDGGAGFIVVTGLPIRESVVQMGPFVMNTEEEIRQAVTDYRSGRLVRRTASAAR